VKQEYTLSIHGSTFSISKGLGQFSFILVFFLSDPSKNCKNLSSWQTSLRILIKILKKICEDTHRPFTMGNA